jgi:hypothetical protein
MCQWFCPENDLQLVILYCAYLVSLSEKDVTLSKLQRTKLLVSEFEHKFTYGPCESEQKMTHDGLFYSYLIYESKQDLQYYSYLVSASEQKMTCNKLQ